MRPDNVKTIDDLIKYAEALNGMTEGDKEISLDEVLRLLRRVKGGKEYMTTITLTASEIIDRSSNILVNVFVPHTMQILSRPVDDFILKRDDGLPKRLSDVWGYPNRLCEALYELEDSRTPYNIIFFDEDASTFNFVDWKPN